MELTDIDEGQEKTKGENPDYLNERKKRIGEKMIRALSKYLGPKSSNPNTLLVYDFNNSTTSNKVLKDVKEFFNYFFYQNYGKGDKSFPNNTIFEQKNDRALSTLGVENKKIIPGLTYAEELSPNGTRFINYHLGTFEKSQLYKFASNPKFGGMFIYALDRDGMTHESPDDKTLVKTNFLWTKTLIQVFNGITIEDGIKAANHNLDRIKYVKQLEEENGVKKVNGENPLLLEEETFEKRMREVKANIKDQKTLFHVNKYILGLTEIGNEKIKPLNSDYDPTLELKIMKMPEVALSKKALDETTKDERKEYEIDKSYRELAKAIGYKRPVQEDVSYKLGQLITVKAAIPAEKNKVAKGVFSTLEFSTETLDKRFNIGYTFSKQKHGYYHNIYASGIAYGNFGVFSNLATNLKDISTLVGMYYNVDNKIVTYTPNIAFEYILDREVVDTHFFAVKLGNNFKFYAYKNKKFKIIPTLDLNIETGAYHSTDKKNSSEFKYLYNHKMKFGVDFGYKVRSFNIGAKLGVYNTVTVNKTLPNKFVYDFGASLDAKIGYDINSTTSININGGYSRTIKDNLFKAGLEFSKLF